MAQEVAGDRTEEFRERLQAVPDEPGVYLFRDNRSQVIYVGKALRLRDRLRSYFTPGYAQTARVAELVRKATDFEFVTTGERGRGAGPRVQPHQELPAAVQHPAQGRQELPLPEAAGQRRSFRASTTRAGCRTTAPSTSAPTPRPSRCAEPSSRSGSCCRSGPAPTRSSSRARCVSTSTSSAARDLASAGSAAEDYQARINEVALLHGGAVGRARPRAQGADGGRGGRASTSRTPRATATSCSRSSASPTGRRSSRAAATTRT